MQTQFVANCQDMQSNLPWSQDLFPGLWLHNKLENVVIVTVDIDLCPFCLHHHFVILLAQLKHIRQIWNTQTMAYLAKTAA